MRGGGQGKPYRDGCGPGGRGFDPRRSPFRRPRNRGVFVKFPELELDGLQPFCYVDVEARRSELHIHTFAAYPDQVTMIKTQSLFDFQ